MILPWEWVSMKVPGLCPHRGLGSAGSSLSPPWRPNGFAFVTVMQGVKLPCLLSRGNELDQPESGLGSRWALQLPGGSLSPEASSLPEPQLPRL